MEKRNPLFHALAMVVIAMALSACATSTTKSNPPTPIASVADIAGAWTGTLEFGAGEQRCTLTIGPTGTAQIVGATMTATGTVAVRDGSATYDFPGRSSGSATLWVTGGKRELVLKGRSGTFEAHVNPK